MHKTEALFRKIALCVAPPKKLTVSQWADENMVLSSSSAAEPGRWNTDRVPFQRAMMDAVCDPRCEKLVICASSQIGKSAIVNNIIGYYIDVDPCPMIMVQPTIQTAQEYSKQRIAPMIADVKALKKKVSDVKTRDSENTILMKVFDGGFLTIAGANSPAGLASKPVRIVLCDEVDRFPVSAGAEGDPVKLVEKRTRTFANKKLIYTSTPTIKGASRIEYEYEKGSREVWKHECPYCGDFFTIRFADLRFEYDKTEFDGRNQYAVKDVKWRCPACMQEFDEYKIKRAPAVWEAENPDMREVRSFKVNAFYSPFAGWKSLVQEFLDSKDDPEMLKTFYNTVLGESWEERGEIEDEAVLMNRCEDYGAELPDGVIVLTCGIDTQDDRLEYEVIGWGHGDECWGIEKGVLMGRPNEPEIWERLIAVLDKRRAFADGRELTVSMACVDSGGHYTDDVYKYCKLYEGRALFAIKGRGGAGIPFTGVAKRNNKYRAALFVLGVDAGKTQVMSQLKVESPGVRYCHFPQGRGYDEYYFKGLLSERKVLRKKSGQMEYVWEKVRAGIRNEALDCRCYAMAALRILNPNYDYIEQAMRGELPVQKPKPKRQAVKRGNVW